MKYLNRFSSISDAVGKKIATPNVCVVNSVDEVLLVPQLSVDEVVIVKNNDFIDYQLLEGAFLLLSNGQLLHSSSDKLKESYTSDEVTGIVVSTDNGTLLFPAKALSQYYFCGGGVTCPDATLYNSATVAINAGYVGEADTETFRKKLTNSTWAVNIAYNTILNGQHCWLPSLAELKDIVSYKTDITSLLTRCGVTWSFNEIWSSSLAVRKSSTDALQTMYGYYWQTSSWDGYNVQGMYTVLPVTSYKI